MRIIIAHQNADLDAMASMIAARRLYGEGRCLRSRNISSGVRQYLALHKDWLEVGTAADVSPGEVDEVVVVDVRDGRRLKEFAEHIAAAGRVVVFDHHPASEHDVDAAEVVVEPVGACATLLCERIRDAGIELTAQEATLFLLGIYADTGNLSFDSTTARDVDIAAFLLRQGANLAVVNRYLQGRFTREQRGLLVDLLADAHEESFGGVEIGFARGDEPKPFRGVSDVVEHVVQLGGFDAFFGVVRFSKNDRVQVVGRSRVPYVDVGAILSDLGGGGHVGAAAASFKGESVAEIMDRLRGRIAEARLRPTRVRDLMSSPVETICHDTTLRQARDLLERWVVRGAPVMRDGELDGIISQRDIQRAAEAEQLDIPVAGFMSHELMTIHPDEPLEDALEMMTDHDIGRLPVVVGERLLGIISRSDILNRLYGDAETGAEGGEDD